jgi:hypothetical protein
VWIGVENDENGIQRGSYVAYSLRYYFFGRVGWTGRLGAWTGEVGAGEG